MFTVGQVARAAGVSAKAVRLSNTVVFATLIHP